MSSWILCNSCFNAASPERQLAVTTCSHVVCSFCFQRGKQGECIICNTKCELSPLSDKSSAEVKALFSDINVIVTRHFTEISKVLLFQARQQKRLLSYYQQRNEKLEEALVKMRQETQQMAKKLNEQSDYISKLERSLQRQSAKALSMSQMSLLGSHTPSSSKSVLQIPFNSPVFRSQHSSTTNLAEQVDGRNLFRKPDLSTRLSLISPPRDGRIGTVPHQTANQNRLVSHSARSATVSRSHAAPLTPDVFYGHSSGWESPIIENFFRGSMSSLICPPP